LNNLIATPNENLDLNKCIANYLLSLQIGERMISTREIAEVFGASLGSVSTALNNLEEIGAATISRRGRLGSFLERKSYGLLWKVVENGPMVIALTLPTFSKSEGLATAIYSLLDQANIEAYLIFIRGSFNRLKALRNNRCHAVVMSELAAKELCTRDEETILTLPPKSFVIDHRVFYRVNKNRENRPLRVAIDLDSFDIKYLTELEFADSQVEFRPTTFSETDRTLDQSEVDAVISNLDHLDHLVSDAIASRPLSPRVQALIADRDTSATFIIRAGSVPTRIILKEILKPEAILEIQHKVEDKQLVPRY
jgi:hypothetical protein